jgi:hypothetical protein
MKHNQALENTMIDHRPRRAVGWITEKVLSLALAAGLLIGLLLGIGIMDLIRPNRSPLDLNHDGKITLTDLVQVKQLEKQIVDKLQEDKP